MSEPTSYSPPRAASPDCELVSTRTLPFPRARVFTAWTHPDWHAKWWGPAGFTNTFHEYDLRPGGQWRFIMHGPDGTNYDNHSVFDHIAVNECIVFRHTTAPEFTVVATFTDDGEGTHVEFRMIFANAEICAAITKYAKGKNEENFDRLTTALAEMGDNSGADRELVMMRIIEAPPATIYQAWATRLPEWFCPKPWTVPHCDMDLRAGGRFHTVMQGPNPGETNDLEGIFLEVTPNERIVFTDAYQVGWRTTANPFMTGVFTMEDLGDGRSRFTGRARHWSAEKCTEHAAMGFYPGWSAMMDQLNAVAIEINQSL